MKADVKDWNDVYRAGGSARRAADNAKAWSEPEQNGEQASNAKSTAYKLRRVADVEAAPVSWLWPGYLARGKLTLLGGDPDLGKSLLRSTLRPVKA
jgi:hypothetical protein